MNYNAVKLTPMQISDGNGGQVSAEFPLSTHKVYLEGGNTIVVRDCGGSGTPYSVPLDQGAVGIGVISGNFCLGTLEFTGPTLLRQIPVYKTETKAGFQHLCLDNVFGSNIESGPAYNIELIGSDDLRYECMVGGVESPRIHRFLLSQCFVNLEHLQVGGNDTLNIEFQSNAIDSGYTFLVSTV